MTTTELPDDVAFLDVPAPSRDGLPFAASEERPGVWAFSLRPGKRGMQRPAAAICEMLQDGSWSAVASVPLDRFLPVMKKVEDDFNGRLVANGHPPGSMPRVDGRVLMNSGFGRELALLLIATFDHHVGYAAAIAWAEATPTWRRQLFAQVDQRRWHEIDAKRREDDRKRAETGDLIPRERAGSWRKDPQTAYELLCYRAPDGSEDLGREAAAKAGISAQEAKIWAIRRKSPEWGSENKVSWNRR